MAEALLLGSDFLIRKVQNISDYSSYLSSIIAAKKYHPELPIYTEVKTLLQVSILIIPEFQIKLAGKGSFISKCLVFSYHR